MKLVIDKKRGGIIPVVPDKDLDAMATDFMANNPYGVHTFFAHVVIAVEEATRKIKYEGVLTIPSEYGTVG